MTMPLLDPLFAHRLPQLEHECKVSHESEISALDIVRLQNTDPNEILLRAAQEGRLVDTKGSVVPPEPSTVAVLICRHLGHPRVRYDVLRRLEAGESVCLGDREYPSDTMRSGPSGPVPARYETSKRGWGN